MDNVLSKEVLQERWKEIQKQGGPEAYIKRELKKRGVYLSSPRMNIIDIKDEKQKRRAIAAARIQAAAVTELRKYVMEARLSSQIHHLGPDIFWNDFIGDSHFDPYARDTRIKDNDLPSIETLEELMAFLKTAVPEIDVPMLRSMCSHREVATVCHYRQFQIPKKTGGVRKIWAPLPRLKALQKLIQCEIVEKMTIHGSAHGFVAGKSIYTNAEQHSNSKVVVGVDLQDFFPTFTFPRVKGIFRNYGYPQGIATLLALLCTEAPRRMFKLGDEVFYVASGPRVLPQGSPASPGLTNVACLRLDRRLSQYALNNQWRYSRYADDLTFSKEDGSGTPDVRSLLRMVHHVTNSEGLRVHPKKTHIMTKGRRQEVTGLIVNGPDSPRVPSKRRRMLRAALHNAQNGNTAEGFLTFEQLMGNAAFVYAAQPELGRMLLDKFSELLGQNS